jgi:hypothetical protein
VASSAVLVRIDALWALPLLLGERRGVHRVADRAQDPRPHAADAISCTVGLLGGANESRRALFTSCGQFPAPFKARARIWLPCGGAPGTPTGARGAPG